MTVLYGVIKVMLGMLDNLDIKLPFSASELIDFYDKYCKKFGIVDKRQKSKVWWAMFYHAKEGILWTIPEEVI
ncbi:hypothetical protein ES703_82305 [subsurface metagenome]